MKALHDAIDDDFLHGEFPLATEPSLVGIGQITRIVLTMKEFSRSGTRNLAAPDLNRALENTITISRNEWKRTAEVETDFDPTLPMDYCLIGDMKQAFLNLIVNAAHAIGEVPGRDIPGRIVVSIRREGARVEVLIGDNGNGIPEKIPEKVFDPFFTTKEVGEGTGQGMTIARDIVVNKHPGSIRFEAETGVGTMFVLSIPIQRPISAKIADLKKTPHSGISL